MTPPAASHRITTDALGAPVLVKRMEGSEGRTRLVGEAAVLRALDHPGTVRVVDLVEDDDGAELHLAWVGPHSLATVTGVPAAEAGRLVASVAEVVADLHRTGVVHRRLTPDHVLLGPDGRAVLTGLAEAVNDGRADTAEDVAALGALLTTLALPAEEGSVVPERRRRRARDPGLRNALLTLADLAAADDPEVRPPAAELASRLRDTVDPPRSRRDRHPAHHPPPVSPSRSAATPDTVAPRASDPTTVPAPAPSAGVLGATPAPRHPHRARSSLPATAPGKVRPPGSKPPAAVIDRPDHAPRNGVRPRAAVLRARLREVPPGRRVAVVVLVLAVVGTLVAAATVGSDPARQVATSTPPSTTQPVGTDAGADPRPSATDPPGPADVIPPAPGPAPSERTADGTCPAVPASPAADIDGDGCPDAVQIEGQRISVGGTTWVIGRPGDAVAVADWDCNGTATVASLRPSTGEVFVFERWVTAGDELTVPAATTVPWAETLRAVDDDGDGCAQLTAVGEDGRSVAVPLGSL